ncbi:MAG: MoaD/ThiS family protein [Deltaproteobacteria bacterium]|nr:MoaD/ThiS family protein [Deltaproteobacteria bacterium]TLN01311.1 MAG: MoaD/ThiS family protein [bacterium]
MKISVKCFSTLVKENVCDYRGAKEHEIPAGTTVNELIGTLALPADEIKIVFVNSKEVGAETVLRDGDKVAFSPVTGGM